ncbi:hypothetical protein GP486_001440 [Trichoglossum hirsutum]|uniref:Protein kinase domain-containing protein n=1 Tax=Trichoglossum hirsutum TaxID=265104 RepID=A0A9P8LGN3_9PEZI|nr:hypothetical protein GP486_001440 [Trichoglossum hirsutum]
MASLTFPPTQGRTSLPSEVAEREIDRLFSRTDRYPDEEIDRFSVLLGSADRPLWSKTPRLYIVLRTIGKLGVLDELIDDGFNDLWLPLSAEHIANYSCLSETDFLTAQRTVLTDVVALERGRHQNLDLNVVPLESEGYLGRGSYGVVQKVSHFAQVFAQKTIWRQVNFSTHRENMNSFKKELEALRRLNHRHIVELKGSYTDQLRAALLMKPVADCNLAQYFERAQNATGQDAVGRRSAIRSFFGCLTDAVAYVHKSQIRHKDIKPTNILVHGTKVILTDFGTSRDWSDMSRSATTGPIETGTREYRSPEVAKCKPRKSSSDIWSLGCVFLEMVTVLKGRRVEALKEHMRKETESQLYWCNLVSVERWIRQLRQREPSRDNIPLEWVEKMLQKVPGARCTAAELKADILGCGSPPGSRSPFCGDCCDGVNWVMV